MGQFNNEDNFPILETLGDGILYRWNSYTNTPFVERFQSDRHISFDQAMFMVGTLMRNTESTFCEASDNPWMLWFPYLFSQPSAGDKIYNETTKETYTIKEILRDPATKKWRGHVLLETGKTPPKSIERHILRFNNPDRYVKFTDEVPDSLVGREKVSSAGHGTNLPPMKPTVSNVILREEPAGHKEAFAKNLKEIKPRFRHTMVDPIYPGYSIEFYGQILDTLVQFDCWAADSTTARSLAKWFRNVINMNTWILKKNGVVELFFWAQVRDQNTMQYGQDSHACSVQFFFRTERIETVRTKHLVVANVNLQVDREIETERQDEYIAGQFIPADELTPTLRRSLFYDQSGNPRFGAVSIIDNGLDDNF